MAEEKDLYGPKYFDVKLQVEEMSDTGKVKKVKEEHLVWGTTFKEIEQKVKDEMEGTMNDWKIIDIKESSISSIYGNKDD